MWPLPYVSGYSSCGTGQTAENAKSAEMNGYLLCDLCVLCGYINSRSGGRCRAGRLAARPSGLAHSRGGIGPAGTEAKMSASLRQRLQWQRSPGSRRGEGRVVQVEPVKDLVVVVARGRCRSIRELGSIGALEQEHRRF